MRGSLYGSIKQGEAMGGMKEAGLPGSYYSIAAPAGGALQPYQYQRGLQYNAANQAGANQAQNEAGLMTLAGMGMYALSSKEYKEDIKEVDGKGENEVLDMVKNGKTFTYNYKDGMGPKGKRMGLITEHAPSEVVSPDGKMLDIPQEVGMLRTATKALAKKVAKMERRA